MLRNVKLALAAVACLWLIYLLDVVLPFDFRSFGIQPRRISGLWGILFSPFLHLDFRHLAANTTALLVLLTVSFTYNRRLTGMAIVTVMAVGGGLVWLLGKGGTVHIGASGVIFGLIGFMMFIGIFRREWTALIVSGIIFFIYGGALFSLLVYKEGISWSGHFFGFLSGVMAAWWTKPRSKSCRWPST